MPFLRQKPDEQPEQASSGNGASTLMAGYGAADTSSPGGRPQAQVPEVKPSTPQFQGAPADTGSSATGYVNFDRFFNANGDAAKATAARTAQQVGGSAQKAQNDLTGLQQQFGQQSKAGEVQGPSDAQKSWAANGGSRPNAVTSSTQPTATQTGEGLTSEPTKNGAAPTAGPSSAATQSGGHFQPSQALPVGPQADRFYGQQDANMKGAIGAGANGQYTGPTSLDVMAGYGNAESDKAKAQDQLAATQSAGGLQGLLQSQAQPGGYSDSMSAFDAGLTGRAGSQQFAGLRDKYGGLDKMFADANADSQTDAQAAQGRSDAAAAQYGSLESQYDAAQKAKAAAAGAPGAGAPDPLAQWDGFDPATQAYGKNRSDQNNGQATYHFGDDSFGHGDDPNNQQGYTSNGWGFSAAPNGSPGETEGINVGATKGGGDDWSGWFGGADTDNTSPQDMGLTSQEIWSLSLMTPEQRAAWLKKHNGGQ